MSECQMKEYKINNAEVVLKGKCTIDDLIDAIEGNRVYIPALYVINKIDQITIEELDLLDQYQTMCWYQHIKCGTLMSY